MRPDSIPIRSLDAEPDPEVDFLPMPREMSTFEMPHLPEAGPDRDVAGAHAVLADFLARFDDYLAGGGAPPMFDLEGLPPAAMQVLNEALGEGEVSARIVGGEDIRIQETVFSGVWREQHRDSEGRLRHDLLLAAPIPPCLAAAAQAAAAPTLRALALPAGTMNVPALLHELQTAMDRAGPEAPSHVINLTLLPLSPADAAHLDQVLDGGSVVILSRGFGNCRISSTAARHVWRVQYFNNMQTLILNTIEVVPVPEVALAASEDLADSRTRLAELAQWMATQDGAAP